MLVYDVVEAGANDALRTIKQKLNGYRYAWSEVYVGVTQDPEARLQNHQNDGWRKMVVVWEAWNDDITAYMERELIAYGQACNVRTPMANRGPGGEGVAQGSGAWWVYILLR